MFCHPCRYSGRHDPRLLFTLAVLGLGNRTVTCFSQTSSSVSSSICHPLGTYRASCLQLWFEVMLFLPYSYSLWFCFLSCCGFILPLFVVGFFFFFFEPRVLAFLSVSCLVVYVSGKSRGFQSLPWLFWLFVVIVQVDRNLVDTAFFSVLFPFLLVFNCRQRTKGQFTCSAFTSLSVA